MSLSIVFKFTKAIYSFSILLFNYQMASSHISKCSNSFHSRAFSVFAFWRQDYDVNEVRGVYNEKAWLSS